ncbi:MAG TPA: ABC transporter ATP-binding protein [Acidimicrobiales bacterium]|nr:ABC transporter ATP-binding protein [Acidimicrobiales bacterium]
MSALLELDAIDVTYRRQGGAALRAVVGASLQLHPGEIVGLVGESGCGKSTLGRAAVGLVAPSAGEVRYDGRAVPALGRGARASWLRNLQMVFQDPYASLNPRRRVGRQIADAIALGTGRPRPKLEDGPEVAAVLERVGLEAGVARRFPLEFSGGQCQRIAIARVLAAEPRCIVADEPISSLDASAQAQIANLLASVSAETGVALLFISHDLSVVRKVAQRTMVMYLGRVVEEGPTELVWSAPSHPYTASLIASVPVPGAAGRLPAELAGDVPNPARPPSGCRFHPRCPIVVDRCRAEEPPELAAGQPGEGRTARCWRHDTPI